MDEILLQALREKIVKAELSACEAALLATAQIAVDMELSEPGRQTVGESRIGGVPDVPTDWQWPGNAEGEKFAFLLQINLADVPPFEGNPLPSRGLLSFFIGLDEPAADVEHKIFLFDDIELQSAVIPAEEEFADDAYLDLPPHRLKFSLRADVPHWATDDYDQIAEEMNDDEQDAFNDLSLRSQSEIGQLLGHVSGIGHDPRGDAFVVREVNSDWIYNYDKRRELDFSGQTNWRNLLRLDSIRELNMTIWDAGYFNFLIHQNDLANLDFSRVYMAVESS
jgi:uncharacterized protein YwqG